MNFIFLFSVAASTVYGVPVLAHLMDAVAIGAAAHYVPPAMPRLFTSEVLKAESPLLKSEGTLLKTVSGGSMTEAERAELLFEFDKLDKEARDLEDFLKVIGAKIDKMERKEAEKAGKALNMPHDASPAAPSGKPSPSQPQSLKDRLQKMFNKKD